uniref:Leucine-rich repeat-containing N-terminal plant-type domain-containing protein n=1 Tax=Paramoeba aestuarina TaxID=180227 RepID=A0A7S4P8C5_9EUKA|mmetsp:Transcript_37909/g.59947  ORF Transcript_37909/g.59947 Transcript_37909/m.59947 type:complete len:205 (+) Transcript_37909:106-720(+)
MAFYNATNGPNWLMARQSLWGDGDPCGPPSWDGVFCLGNWGLNRNAITNLIGTIPDAFYTADGTLEVLQLQNNPGLGGTISPSMGNFTNLRYLTVHNTGLEGTIPSQLGDLPDLQYMDISNTDLEGPFPDLNISTLELRAQNLGFFGTFPHWVCDILDFDFTGTDFACPQNYSCCIPYVPTCAQHLSQLSLHSVLLLYYLCHHQ